MNRVRSVLVAVAFLLGAAMSAGCGAGPGEGATDPSALPDTTPFNTAAAKATLAEVRESIDHCQEADGVVRKGRVLVKFSQVGPGESATILGELHGTAVGNCVARRFQEARVPPYTGSPVSVSIAFKVPNDGGS